MPFQKISNAKSSETTSKVEFALRACKAEEEKIMKLKQSIEIQRRKVCLLQKLTQQHQAKIRAQDKNVDPLPWVGVPPPMSDLQSIAAMLQDDLDTTEQYTGCAVTRCSVSLLGNSQDEIQKEYEVDGKIASYDFKLKIESICDLLSGEESVSRITSIEIIPASEELIPFQDFLKENTCAYIIPRALRTLQSLEEEILSVSHWAIPQQYLEVVHHRLSLVLRYVPFERLSLSSDSSPQPSPRHSKQRKIKREAGRVLDNTADDQTVKLNWNIAFSKVLKNFRHTFKLVAPLTVQERYSASSIAAFLDQSEPLQSAEDVMQLFSELTH